MDFRLKTLERYQTGGTKDHMQLAMPLPRTSKGMVYRYCPNESCAPRLFLLGEATTDQTVPEDGKTRIRRVPHTPGITCPYCGLDGLDNDFLFPGDIDAAREQVAWAATTDIANHLDDIFKNMVEQVNRGGRAITMRYEEGHREPPPGAWREDLLRNLRCDTCGCAYGVYAIGLFCPDCGTTNLALHFGREIELITKQLGLTQNLSDDEELAYRLLGNAHEDVVTALESYLKTTFRFLVRQRTPEQYQALCSKKAIGTSFQNIEKGRAQFAKLGLDPYAHIGEDDLTALQLNIEKRHIIGHNLGVIDENYAKNAANETTGETVELLASDTKKFADICMIVINRLVEDCPELQPAKSVPNTEEKQEDNQAQATIASSGEEGKR